jgi:adenine-specific DNA-methyltransferase
MRNELDVLLDRVDDPSLRADLRARIDAIQAKRRFGLVFESHLPERVRLPEHAIRRGASVVYRDNPLSPTYQVVAVKGQRAIVHLLRHPDGARLAPAEALKSGDEAVSLDQLVVIADFADPIYPGLRHLGSKHNGGDKPAHLIIKGENHHALELLQFSHAARVDCIYIDPPYNTGASYWKYDNNYVDENDSYRHSKWLAFMARRLRLAKSLLNPDDSVLMIAIDDTEVHRLGLLLDDVFKGCERQILSVTMSPRGKSRPGRLSQVDDYLILVYIGAAKVADLTSTETDTEVRWRYLRRTDLASARGTVKGGPSQFYPIYVDDASARIVAIGEPLAPDDPLDRSPARQGATAVFPINEHGVHFNWGLTGSTLKRALDRGYVRVTPGSHGQPFTIAYLTDPNIRKFEEGAYRDGGLRPDGSRIVLIPGGKTTRPTTAWRATRYDAGAYGTGVLGALIPGRTFPFPKSLYAVEDALRLFVKDKPDALILDFFGGSATTAHAVFRLNRQDGGNRQVVLVTNNELSAKEAASLRKLGHRPGDPEWEQLGVFEHIARPRVEAALTGLTPEGRPVAGDYKFIDEFPMSKGFEENADFLEIVYLDPDDVELDLAFAAVAPLLWMKAGGRGAIIMERRDSSGRRLPFAVTDHYGILFNPDRWRSFLGSLPATAPVAFIVTDSQATFTGVARELPTGVTPVRLYENYMQTFAIDQSR